jgi:hypothetical protein
LSENDWILPYEFSGQVFLILIVEFVWAEQVIREVLGELALATAWHGAWPPFLVALTVPDGGQAAVQLYAGEVEARTAAAFLAEVQVTHPHILSTHAMYGGFSGSAWLFLTAVRLQRHLRNKEDAVELKEQAVRLGVAAADIEEAEEEDDGGVARLRVLLGALEQPGTGTGEERGA